MTDPLGFMNIDKSLKFYDARTLKAQQRAKMLAASPIAADEIFRKKSIHFFMVLFVANNRYEIQTHIQVEQKNKSRHSPHIHFMI